MAELIVGGFHRSGTSLLTELLHRAGLFVGDDLLGALPSNPYGHFEDKEVLRIHDRILRDNGLNWQVDRPFIPYIDASRWRAMQDLVDRRRAAHRLWGFKDPRVCFFLPAWKHLLPGMKTIIVYRNPAESVASLHRRQTSDLVHRRGNEESHRRFWAEPDFGLRMWLAHNQALAAFARAYPEDTLVLSFDALAAGYPIVEQSIDRLGVKLNPIPTFKVFDPTVTATETEVTYVYDSPMMRVVQATLDELHSMDETTRSEGYSIAT
ncbi:MAG: sulfotransferase [Actinomycetota bacterium]